jgi:hypothetical protein
VDSHGQRGASFVKHRKSASNNTIASALNSVYRFDRSQLPEAPNKAPSRSEGAGGSEIRTGKLHAWRFSFHFVGRSQRRKVCSNDYRFVSPRHGQRENWTTFVSGVYCI